MKIIKKSNIIRLAAATWNICERVFGKASLRFILLAMVVIAMMAYSASSARADLIPLGNASNYAVLYEGTGGHNLSIANDYIGGSIGVGGSGVVQFSGPGTITGQLNFSAANSGQYHNTNGSNVGPTSVSYGNTNVTNALGAINTLSSGISGGTNIAFTNAGETINESDGALVMINGIATRLFNLTSYSASNSSVLTINGDGSGNPVVFNFASSFNSNVNLGGSVVLAGTGLTSPDQVLFNFQSTGKNINLTNNGQIFQGIILAPNDTMSMSNVNLYGRFLGGGSSDMHIVSGANIYSPSPSPVPIPSALLLFGPGLAGLVALRRRLNK